MRPEARGIVIGTGGLFAGLLAAQLVSWSPGPRALLAMGVSVGVSCLLLFATKGRTHGQRVLYR